MSTISLFRGQVLDRPYSVPMPATPRAQAGRSTSTPLPSSTNVTWPAPDESPCPSRDGVAPGEVEVLLDHPTPLVPSYRQSSSPRLPRIVCTRRLNRFSTTPPIQEQSSEHHSQFDDGTEDNTFTSPAAIPPHNKNFISPHAGRGRDGLDSFEDDGLDYPDPFAEDLVDDDNDIRNEDRLEDQDGIHAVDDDDALGSEDLVQGRGNMHKPPGDSEDGADNGREDEDDGEGNGEPGIKRYIKSDDNASDDDYGKIVQFERDKRCKKKEKQERRRKEQEDAASSSKSKSSTSHTIRDTNAQATAEPSVPSGTVKRKAPSTKEKGKFKATHRTRSRARSYHQL